METDDKQVAVRVMQEMLEEVRDNIHDLVPPVEKVSVERIEGAVEYLVEACKLVGVNAEGYGVERASSIVLDSLDKLGHDTDTVVHILFLAAGGALVRAIHERMIHDGA